MESKFYHECLDKINKAALLNESKIKGNVWCSIGNDINTEPVTAGPFRYTVNNGMDIYKKIIYHRLTDENKKKSDELINRCVDFMVFINKDHQCVTEFEKA